MTTEGGRDDEPTRRKFDDVASLFGTIVPAPGTPIRPLRPFRPIPTSLPADVSSIVPAPKPNRPVAAEQSTEPDAEPESEEEERPPAPPARLPPMRAAVPPENLVERPRPTEIPWPDAFEPRPNFRYRETRQWTWLLLIPAGLVAAAAVTLIDTRMLREWVDTKLLHRTATVASTASPSLPAPFRSGEPAGTPPPAEPVVEAPVPFPAIPTSPVPVPPGTEVSPPPAEPTQPGSPAPTIHVNIQYRRSIPGAEGEARRIATLLQGVGGSVELKPNVTTVRSPTINYYNAADRESASALALVLGHEASSWTVRLGTGKYPPGTLDVWLP